MPSTPTEPATVAELRNVAIIAHVDHGKTSLVDKLLMQSGMFRAGELEKLAGGQHDLILDSNPLERERGITILSKNCSVLYASEKIEDGHPLTYRVNIIDTPGHADFGGEVERVLRMADGCLLLVDAFEGPMPQTKFVLGKALEAGLRPVVVVNKCDRAEGDPNRVLGEVFDLLIELGADDMALDFPVVYASAREGWASTEWPRPESATTLRPIFESIISHVPPPEAYIEKPFRMQVTTLGFSEYTGRIGVGRIHSGTARAGMPVALVKQDLENPGVYAKPKIVKIGKLEAFRGLGKIDAPMVHAGDLCAIAGIEGIDIGDTLCDPDFPDALPPLTVDEPTISMLFRINDSPFAGQDGDYVTSRQIRTRLERELEHNVALRVEPGAGTDEFMVSGRGVLHLGILLETMRREGYEISVGKPIVIEREIDGVIHEPLERLVVDAPNEAVGSVMQLVGERRGELLKMEARGATISHMVFEITSRALIGLRGRVLTASQGEAIMHHTFDRMVPKTGEAINRHAGVLIANETGSVTTHALENMHDRGVMFVRPGDKVYAGQIVGEHNRDNDLTVNICRLKQLNNIRSANKEATVTLKAPRSISLEQALEYVTDDELVELTPVSIRMRKRILEESMRRRADRQSKDKTKANA